MDRRAELGMFSLLTIAAVTMAGLLVKREFFPRPEIDAPIIGAAFDSSLTRVSESTELANGEGRVRIVQFLDLQCPACSVYHRDVIIPFLSEVRAKELDVSFSIVHLPLSNHPFALIAAHASECAERQGRFEPFIEHALNDQRSFSSSPWQRFAVAAAVSDTIAFQRCLEDAAPQKIASGLQLSDRVGIRATPTMVVNGWILPKPVSKLQLLSMVKRVTSGKDPF